MVDGGACLTVRETVCSRNCAQVISDKLSMMPWSPASAMFLDIFRLSNNIEKYQQWLEQDRINDNHVREKHTLHLFNDGYCAPILNLAN